jgi:hypothetical protein
LGHTRRQAVGLLGLQILSRFLRLLMGIQFGLCRGRLGLHGNRTQGEASRQHQGHQAKS